jgi:hypothetical protein
LTNRGSAVCPVTVYQELREVEDALVHDLQRHVLSDKMLATILDQVRAEITSQIPQRQADVIALEADLATMRAEQKRLAKAVALSDSIPELVSELQQRSAHRKPGADRGREADTERARRARQEGEGHGPGQPSRLASGAHGPGGPSRGLRDPIPERRGVHSKPCDPHPFEVPGDAPRRRSQDTGTALIVDGNELKTDSKFELYAPLPTML